jgi:hypothetical protein
MINHQVRTPDAFTSENPVHLVNHVKQRTAGQDLQDGQDYEDPSKCWMSGPK